jgi:SAM-dependent methyltransferase
VQLHGADIRDGDLFEPFHRFSDLRFRRLTDPVTLPYPDRYFDAVIGHGVLEHVPDPEASLGELHRVLALGGTLLIDALPNRFSYIEEWHRHTGGPAHERRFGLREITGMLERQGFRVVRRRRVEMLPMMLNSSGPRARRAYERANGLVATANRLLGHRPLNVFATSLAIAALKEN